MINYTNNLGAWTPSKFVVPQSPIRDRLGMGAWAPAGFAVPQNPIAGSLAGRGMGVGAYGSAMTIMGRNIYPPGFRITSSFAQPAKPKSGVGAWSPARYVVPQNPIRDRLTGKSAGCGCGGGCGHASAGLGDLSDYLPSMPDLGTTFGISNLYLYGGVAVLAYFLLARGGDYREERRAAKAAYSRRIGRARKTYVRGYRRAYDAYQDARG